MGVGPTLYNDFVTSLVIYSYVATDHYMFCSDGYVKPVTPSDT